VRRIAIVLVGLGLPAMARADAASIVGHGARSAGLAQADVADARPEAAAFSGPTAAATPGTRFAVGWTRTENRLTFAGAPAGLAAISGTDVDLQLGRSLAHDVSLGGALALHLPDRGLARITFRAAGEPQFLRYDAAAHRTTADAVVALRWRALSVAAGAALGASAGGAGVDFHLPQDARGPHADSAADITLKTTLAPIFAAAVDLGPATLALRLRGATSLPVRIVADTRVDLSQNPLNGTTTVSVDGSAGYDPLTIDLAARITLPAGARAFASLQYARWRDAPSPIAAFDLALALGITPSVQLGGFEAPRLHDTLSPRLGVELAPDEGPWAARVGWQLAPSPVPAAHGFLTPIDPTRHVLAAGGSARFGRLWGVDTTLDAFGALHLASHDSQQKESLALPWSRYDVGGHLASFGATLTGRFR
jgi:hypothetical protein